MKLTEEQKSIIKNIIRFEKKIQLLGGYAGTGKSTVIRNLIEILPNFAVCAYTGKAANVLRTKGIENSTTIHSLIYKAHTSEDKVYFTLASSIPYDGVIVDEASMVSEDIYKDLISFNKPVIFVGDHGQLEPINDKFNLMKNPDYKLETIHRNAGEIAHFCQYVRSGFKPSSWQHRHPSKNISFINKNSVEEVVENIDQVICAYNKKRVEINKMVRKKLGKNNDFPTISDRIICLRNDKEKKLFNGMQGHIGWFIKKNYIKFVADDLSIDTNFDPKSFNQEKYEVEYDKTSPTPFDYAYAVTCHKSQGSEYDKVLVLEQKSTLWDSIRWNYTAASRAKEKLYWCNM